MTDTITPKTFLERIDIVTADIADYLQNNTTGSTQDYLVEWVARLQCRNFTMQAANDSLSDRIDELNATITQHQIVADDLMSENIVLREANAQASEFEATLDKELADYNRIALENSENIQNIINLENEIKRLKDTHFAEKESLASKIKHLEAQNNNQYQRLNNVSKAMKQNISAQY